MQVSKNTIWKYSFILRTVTPAALTVLMFVFATYFIIMPYVENLVLENKKEVVKELANATQSILGKLESEVKKGNISEYEARLTAKLTLNDIRYGKDNKKYFWVIDTTGTVIIHPYRTELIGRNLIDFKDEQGNPFISRALSLLENSNSALIEYYWQIDDDATRVSKKLSFLKKFEPWGWIVSTGLYYSEIDEELSYIDNKIFLTFIVITLLITALLILGIKRIIETERSRNLAEQELEYSRNRYRALVEASEDGILMVLDNRFVFSNSIVGKILGYSSQEFKQMDIYSIFYKENSISYNYFRAMQEGFPTPEKFEAKLKHKSGEEISVIMKASLIILEGKKGFIVNLKETVA